MAHELALGAGDCGCLCEKEDLSLWGADTHGLCHFGVNNENQAYFSVSHLQEKQADPGATYQNCQRRFQYNIIDGDYVPGSQIYVTRNNLVVAVCSFVRSGSGIGGTYIVRPVMCYYREPSSECWTSVPPDTDAYGNRAEYNDVSYFNTTAQ